MIELVTIVRAANQQTFIYKPLPHITQRGFHCVIVALQTIYFQHDLKILASPLARRASDPALLMWSQYTLSDQTRAELVAPKDLIVRLDSSWQRKELLATKVIQQIADKRCCLLRREAKLRSKSDKVRLAPFLEIGNADQSERFKRLTFSTPSCELGEDLRLDSLTLPQSLVSR